MNDSILSVIHFIIYILLVIYIVLSILISIETLQDSLHFSFLIAIITSWGIWSFYSHHVELTYTNGNKIRAYVETALSFLVFFIINLFLWDTLFYFS